MEKTQHHIELGGMTMEFKKIEINGYILGVALVKNGGNITETEYNEISEVFRNRPTVPDGYGNRLKADLTWEQYELSNSVDDPELTADESLAIIMGGATNA